MERARRNHNHLAVIRHASEIEEPAQTRERTCEPRRLINKVSVALLAASATATATATPCAGARATA